MAIGFPPQPTYPLKIDSDRTLFLVFNTSEAQSTGNNSAWAEEIEIEPVDACKPEIWADNGFANISGELFYYDSVEKTDVLGSGGVFGSVVVDSIGSIISVEILNGGFGYCLPAIVANGEGKGAKLNPIVTNGSIESVEIVNGGSGYKSSTTTFEIQGKVKKFKRCARNIGGKKTQFNPIGSWVRGYVVAEHHNQLVDATIAIEEYLIGLEDDIIDLESEPKCLDDSKCPEVILEIEEDNPEDPCLGKTITYRITINGTYITFKLDFGDGESTTSAASGTHTYSPNSIVDPLITITSNSCSVVQTPIKRDIPKVPNEPPPTTPPKIPIPPPPDFPTITIPNCPQYTQTFDVPQIIIPTIDIVPTNPNINITFTPPEINIPNINVNPINFSANINFGPAPEINGANFNFNGNFNFGPAPSVNFNYNGGFNFGPAPEINVSGGSFNFGPAPLVNFNYNGRFNFGPAPLINYSGNFNFGPAPNINFPNGYYNFGPAPNVNFPSGNFNFGPAPLVNYNSYFDWGSPPSVDFNANFNWGSPPTLNFNFNGNFNFGPAPNINYSGNFNFGPAPLVNFDSYFDWGSPPNVNFNGSFNWGSPPNVSGTFNWGSPPDINGSFNWGSPPNVNFNGSFNWGSPPTVDFNGSFNWGSPPTASGSFNWGSPPSVYINFNWGSPPTVSGSFNWGSPPSVNGYFNWGSPPDVGGTFNWGSPPEVGISWGSPPTVTVSISCPSGAPFTKNRFDAQSLDDNFVDDFDENQTMQVQIDNSELGIPSEIKIIAPEFPDIKITHDIPEVISVQSTLPSRIELYQENPILHAHEIKLINDVLPNTIEIKADNVPKSIKLDSSSLPSSISLTVPDFPSIKIDASGIPDSIKVVGIPDSIEIKMPSEIIARLELPENLEVPLVYRGGPVPIQFDASNLSGSEGAPCFQLVPCDPKK